jgi:hypothetical protein
MITPRKGVFHLINIYIKANRMFKEIPKSDIIVRPIKVYKEWTLDENDISPYFGENPMDTYINLDTDVKTNGITNKLIYTSIKSQFYTNPSTASLLTEVGRRKSYASTDERILDNTIAVFSIPQSYYGDGIKIGSVSLYDAQSGKMYNDDSYSNLLDSGSNIRGNIFYDRGLIVISRDVVSGSVLSQFTLNFRSTKTIFENEVFLSVLENEFNTSQNPSAVYEDGGSIVTHTINKPGVYPLSPLNTTTINVYEAGTKYIKNGNHPFISKINPKIQGSFDDYYVSGSSDRTGSYLAPFITTIGLYDNDLNMVAVAKLPKPIKSLHDYPINFIVRFDT